jgi:hypothetical protein
MKRVKAGKRMRIYLRRIIAEKASFVKEKEGIFYTEGTESTEVKEKRRAG